MATQGYPQSWVPYENIKDCSQGFCSLYCPQWCYFIFSPPPPFELLSDNSNPNLSPLVIAIIGILASAFLLVSYYTLISKYCGNLDSLRRRENHEPSEEFYENRDQMPDEQWQIATLGLDEAIIKSITVCKYKKSDGLIEGTDCLVCLSEFQEDESLRLLPKCSHAFHLPCIDTWLRSHSNCPLCRANIAYTNPLPLRLSPPALDNPLENRFLQENQYRNDTLMAVVEDSERSAGEEEESDAIIEIGEERVQPIRRSVSMDSSCQVHISISNMLCIYKDEDYRMKDRRFSTSFECLEREEREDSKCNSRSRVLHCVMNPTAMKRSFSCGRYLFIKNGRGRKSIIPI